MGDLFTAWFGPKGPLPEDSSFGPKYVVHKSPIYTAKTLSWDRQLLSLSLTSPCPIITSLTEVINE
jgi:hypothetical protein